MYYILDCDEPLSENGEALLRISNTFQVGEVWSWKSGHRLEPDEVIFETPIRVPFERLRGYVGETTELIDLGITIMSERLYHAFDSAGVMNIEWFDAVLENSQSGERLPYKAYNIDGLIAAADLKKSIWESADSNLNSDVSFQSLVLDETQIHGERVFRLAENVNALVIHASVRKAIEKAGITTVKFVKTSDWVQL